MKTSSNVLVIVLSVLGGILFIGLVVVAVCILRRMRNNDQQVSPLSAMMVRGNTIRVNNPDDLNTQEI
jgi:FtsH-binding integral membrane protein